MSRNPLTAKSCTLPKDTNERQAIDDFLLANLGKKIIAVQGLGFVGAVMALICASAEKENYAVLGVDRNTEDACQRIRSLNEGVFPLNAEDPLIDTLFQTVRQQGNFYATFDPYAYALADVIIVDVNLDVIWNDGKDSEEFDVDLDNFRAAIRTIGQHCKQDVLILVETTVPPGTCGKIIQPLLEQCFEQRGLSKDCFMLGHAYERVMPGPDYIHSIRNVPRVYAGMNDKSADATEKFLRTILHTDAGSLTRLNSTDASEMAKVLENTYRAMNIAFMVEWSRFAEEASVDLYAIVNAIRQRPTHVNLMFPGIGVGGYCLTKDPLLASWSRKNMFGGCAPLGQSECSVSINNKMPLYAFVFFVREYTHNLKGLRLLLLGVSYRSEIGDTRSTPVAPFYDCLVGAGVEPILHDPYLDHWPEKGVPVHQDIDYALNQNFEVVVISTGHKLYGQKKIMDALMTKKNLFIYDTIGFLSSAQIFRLQEKHTVKVLGRGDL